MPSVRRHRRQAARQTAHRLALSLTGRLALRRELAPPAQPGLAVSRAVGLTITDDERAGWRERALALAAGPFSVELGARPLRALCGEQPRARSDAHRRAAHSRGVTGAGSGDQPRDPQRSGATTRCAYRDVVTVDPFHQVLGDRRGVEAQPPPRFALSGRERDRRTLLEVTDTHVTVQEHDSDGGQAARVIVFIDADALARMLDQTAQGQTATHACGRAALHVTDHTGLGVRRGWGLLAADEHDEAFFRLSVEDRDRLLAFLAGSGAARPAPRLTR